MKIKVIKNLEEKVKHLFKKENIDLGLLKLIKKIKKVKEEDLKKYEKNYKIYNSSLFDFKHKYKLFITKNKFTEELKKNKVNFILVAVPKGKYRYSIYILIPKNKAPIFDKLIKKYKILKPITIRTTNKDVKIDKKIKTTNVLKHMDNKKIYLLVAAGLLGLVALIKLNSD